MNFGSKRNGKEECKSDPKIHNKYKEIISTIPRRNGGWVVDLYQYEGFWCGAHDLRGILSVQDQFTPQPNDVILSSAPKSGTTWLKALSFAIMTRFHFNESTSPLLTRLAHVCVPYLEFKLSSNSQKLDLDVPPVATHIPYTSLPKSVINSSCKTVYICRDPKDVFVSLWHFSNKLSPKGMEASPMKEIHLRDAFDGSHCVKSQNQCFFRSGKVGDWKNHLSPTMTMRLDQITEQKLSGSGLTLHVSSKGLIYSTPFMAGIKMV
uniref:Sulfotransferase n=1 Tax=Quercus lobata TaxID=97700 RepID=A0A7N2LV20_QUELO